jgi:hypothetical protein
MKSARHLLIFLAVAFPEHVLAQNWGWPPANYSATGIRHCDCYRYRGLCEQIRDWRHRSGCYPCYSTVVVQPHQSCGCRAASRVLVYGNAEPQRAQDEAETPAPQLLPPNELSFSASLGLPSADPAEISDEIR